MTIVYVTTGAWGVGTGTPNSAAQVDGNFYDVDQRLVGLTADLAEGKRIDTVTYSDSSMTFHFTDGSSQVIPLPVLQLEFVGPWINGTHYVRGQLFSSANGYYQVLEDHTAPAAPAPFDPNATDGPPDNNRLYSFWFPLRDVNYDAAIFVPGSIQREAGELLFQGIANRTMRLDAGNVGAYAYIDIGNDASGATDIVLSIERNGTEIGTVTFDAGGALDSDGGQAGDFVVFDAVDFAAGDRYALRATNSGNSEPSGLSVTIPFLRTNI